MYLLKAPPLLLSLSTQNSKLKTPNSALSTPHTVRRRRSLKGLCFEAKRALPEAAHSCSC